MARGFFVQSFIAGRAETSRSILRSPANRQPALFAAQNDQL